MKHHVHIQASFCLNIPSTENGFTLGVLPVRSLIPSAIVIPVPSGDGNHEEQSEPSLLILACSSLVAAGA
jgi:hypothetical protein